MSFATEYFILNIIMFIIGLIILIKSSSWFVDAAVYIANHFKVPEIIIGLTLVSIGTSLPELATNLYAGYTGDVGIALGNVTGSNIANIGLVLGIGVIFAKKMKITKEIFMKDGLIMLSSFFLFATLCYIGNAISRIDGMILLLCTVCYICFLFTNKRDNLDENREEDEPVKFKSMIFAIIFLVIGLILIFLSAKLMVDTVVKIANDFNMDKALIAATIVAFGTSVPELAVTITSSRKNSHGLALGNIIGSCIFNLLLVMGATSMITEIKVDANMLNIIIPFMLSTGVILLIFMRTGWAIVKAEGIALILIYFSFIIYNVLNILKCF